jgi:hypothetical protein
MGFKMNGSPAKLGSISGTSGHSSALKMKAEANAVEAASSPTKFVPALARGLSLLPKVLPKVLPKAKNIVKGITKGTKNIGSKGPKGKSGFFGNTTSKSSKWLSRAKTIGKHTIGYMALDQAIDWIGGGDDKKTTTPPATSKPKTPKSSSGDAWSKAVNKNKSTGGGVTLSEYVKIRNSNAKGSAKYNAAQNKINEAYGSSKRYGPGTPSSSSASSGTTKTRKRLDGGTTKVTKSDGKKIKVKYDRKGDVKKTITKGDGRRTVTDSEGNITRSRKTRNKKWD